MADLDDIAIPSITEMGTNEAIELLRNIRLSRRIPTKKVTKTAKKKTKAAPKIDASQANELLKILTGGN